MIIKTENTKEFKSVEIMEEEKVCIVGFIVKNKGVILETNIPARLKTNRMPSKTTFVSWDKIGGLLFEDYTDEFEPKKEREEKQNTKTTVWFQMTAKSEAEKVIFNGEPSHNEIDEYFENACGGVYKWWIWNLPKSEGFS